ncbi:phosphatase PAP2 family protein [Aequorivita capsosiphonis]|uniref:phosphatase PAP2 family protein n=1 Tax=Aequorivita capsosiphonis TaxID=487317 RepID=UPI00040C045E|nr:phosphatase PAP2 family protein [Aequorivita capsosiphonis]
MVKFVGILALFLTANIYSQSINQESLNTLQQNDVASLTTIKELNTFSNSLSYNLYDQDDFTQSSSEINNLNTLNLKNSNSPYEWKWLRDGIWTGTALGGAVLGYSLIISKDDITEVRLQEVLAKEKDINFLDKWAAGNDSEAALGQSNIPFAISFATPLVLLFDDDINDHAGQYLGLYLESLATTAAIYTITAGLVNRSRPYVYSDGASLDRRLINNGQRSFYSGHVAAAATATFFAAKVYTDYHPETSGKVFIWGGAAAIPATVGFFRIKAGQHFLTDVLLGYALGAATGILVPELHKKKIENMDVYPSSGTSFNGDTYSGMAFRYSF